MINERTSEQTRIKKILCSKAKLFRKITESEFPVNMHIYILCPKCLQSFTYFYASVEESSAYKLSGGDLLAHI